MATTALFVEILIVGLEAAVWLAGLAMVFGWRPPQDWAPLKDTMPLVTLGLLGAAYVIGIVVDRVSDSAYRAIRRGLRRLGFVEPDEPTPAPVSVMRLWVMKESDGISKFIDYQRSRVRIARATVFNLLPGTAVAAAYVWRQGSGGLVVAGVVGAGCVAALLAFVAAERIHRAHEDRLAEAYLMLSRHSILDEVAAAVCYRRAMNTVQFLLVRTKGGKYWTFPKGHIKKKERDRPWDAARREASEEAGARGTVRQLPFAYYRYPARGEKAPGSHYRVAAYLLEVSGPLGVHEDGRDPTWCAAAQAKLRLAEGAREKIYVTEQQLVIDAALGALGAAG
jgi:8-oxo-dGTP pyrophosphatase MutT (NUDIX family)